MTRNAIAPLIAALTLSLCAAANARPIEPSDILTMVQVSNAQISPDGKSILFVVRRWNRGTASYSHELHVVDTSGQVDRLLLSSPMDAVSPQWSPDGKLVAFLAPDSRPGTPLQIYIAGRDGKARRLTEVPTDVQEIAWRPDSRLIAFVAEDLPDQALVQSQGGRFDAGEDGYTVHAAEMPSQLWAVPVSGGKPTKLTAGPASVGASNPFGTPAPQLSWSPDGTSIGVIRTPTANAGDVDKAVVELIDFKTHSSRSMTPPLLLGGTLAFSPDGHIAYLTPRDATRVNEYEAQVAATTSGSTSVWMQSLDREISGLRWMPDGSMLASAIDGTHIGFWLQTPAGRITPLELGDVGPNCRLQWCDVSVSATGSIAFAGSEPERPSDIYVMTTPGSTPRRVTHYSDAIAALDLGTNATMEWDGPDGFHENGVVYYPPHFSRDKRYPLVVMLHGMISADTREMSGWWPISQLIAAHGYVVFVPNFRGSDNAGNAFQRALFKDTVVGPSRDIVAGIRHIEGLGFIDTSREAVCGWSYGGLLTSWMATQFHNWRAAVAGAAMNNWVEVYDDAGGGSELEKMRFGGSPYIDDHMENYAAQSPMTYAKNITTPTLIWSTTDDPDVPAIESFSMYHALKDNDVPVRFVLYPGATHGPGNPLQAADLTELWVGWLDKYMK